MFDAQQIAETTIAQISTHMQTLHMRLFWGSEPQADPPYSIQLWQARQSSPLREEIALLCRAANGEIDRASASEQALVEIADTVRGIAEITAPDAYFETPIGEVVAVVMAWLRGDDLISYMDAGRLLVAAGLTPNSVADLEDRRVAKTVVERVRRMAEAGTLRRYRNPAPGSEARSEWKLSKSEVEAYIASRLAELGEDDAD